MKRLIVSFKIVFLLLILCTYYYFNHELHEEYPGNEDVINGFEGKVHVYGTVTSELPLAYARGFSRSILTLRQDFIREFGFIAPPSHAFIKAWAMFIAAFKSLLYFKPHLHLNSLLAWAICPHL